LTEIKESGRWINPPQLFAFNDNGVSLQTEPGTDFWQRTFYGFRNENAPAYLFDRCDNFTFTVTVECEYKTLFDQAGIIIWIDQNNWIKASLEYENAEFSRLGVVVTNDGHSDWSTRNSPAVPRIEFRVSRRGPDFLIEARTDTDWEQLRIAHLSALGETTAVMGTTPSAQLTNCNSVGVGVYACSPGASQFGAKFRHLAFQVTTWEMHEG
jgi:regulation of enolase protein 1 (concanavalin A-like superfamily)